MIKGHINKKGLKNKKGPHPLQKKKINQKRKEKFDHPENYRMKKKPVEKLPEERQQKIDGKKQKCKKLRKKNSCDWQPKKQPKPQEQIKRITKEHNKKQKALGSPIKLNIETEYTGVDFTKEYIAKDGKICIDTSPDHKSTKSKSIIINTDESDDDFEKPIKLKKAKSFKDLVNECARSEQPSTSTPLNESVITGDNDREFKLNIDCLPQFSGSGEYGADEYFEKLEELAKLGKWGPNKALLMAQLRLLGEAKQKKDEYNEECKTTGNYTTYDGFKAFMLTAYDTPERRSNLRTTLTNMRQQDMPTRKFIPMLNTVMRTAHVTDNEQKMAYLFTSLDANLATEIKRARITKYNDAIEHVYTMSDDKHGGNTFQKATKPNIGEMVVATTQKAREEARTCSKCDRKGHTALDCRQETKIIKKLGTGSATTTSKLTCDKCKRRGHLAKDCYIKKLPATESKYFSQDLNKKWCTVCKNDTHGIII